MRGCMRPPRSAPLGASLLRANAHPPPTARPATGLLGGHPMLGLPMVARPGTPFPSSSSTPLLAGPSFAARSVQRMEVAGFCDAAREVGRWTLFGPWRPASGPPKVLPAASPQPWAHYDIMASNESRQNHRQAVSLCTLLLLQDPDFHRSLLRSRLPLAAPGLGCQPVATGLSGFC
jgi:hypothetical protein